ncbi:hypothetical protein FRC02_009287 [Tulasnella sp. 418]|nr:hypothetical protein FRC02_009287 [Tulasnella sp. 418]
MTSILSKFDSRLVKLEKSILPVHNSTQALTKLAANIESTLQSIDKIASNQEGIAAEEALILRGPQQSSIGVYTDALERLNANIAFKGNDPRQSLETAHLVETGAKKLAQLYTKLIAQASTSNTIQNPMSYLPSPPNAIPSIPTQAMSNLAPIVNSLRSLPLPATHPSHPAAAGILAVLKEAQAGCAEMRGAWAKKSLESSSRRILGLIETDDSGGGVSTGKEVGKWVESVVAVAEAEHATIQRLALLTSNSIIQKTFATFTSPLLNLMVSTLSSIQSLVKKSVLSNVFFAFGMYSALSDLQPRFDDVMRQRAGRKENDLSEALHALRGVCLRSFPEFIMRIKQVGNVPPPNAKQPDVGTGVSETTIATVEYFNQIPEVRDAVCSALATLGDGNWQMGGGGMGSKTAQQNEEVSDQELLEHFAHDVMVALTTTLNNLSKTHKRPALSSIFLLNNISYLRTKLMLSESSVDEFLSTNTQSHLNSQWRTSKAAYFEANFTALISSLADERKGKSGTKEKFATFFDQLEEVAERHRFARVLAEDEDGREVMAEDVVRLVVPAFQRFLGKHKDKEFSKSKHSITSIQDTC